VDQVALLYFAFALVHDSRGIEIVNITISFALSAGTLMASAGTPYRLVPAHFYPRGHLTVLKVTVCHTAGHQLCSVLTMNMKIWDVKNSIRLGFLNFFKYYSKTNANTALQSLELSRTTENSTKKNENKSHCNTHPQLKKTLSIM